MKITVIGSGYVGLVSGACFSDIGNNVVCLDLDQNRINSLNKGKVPFYEPGLEDLILKNSKKRTLKFTTSYKKAIKFSDTIFISVGTPERKNGSADLVYLHLAVDSICEEIFTTKRNLTIFIKSTVPVGTCKSIQHRIDKKLKSSMASIEVASNPEFLKEGDAINDFMKPDRIIVGQESKAIKELAEKIYRPINWKSNRLKFVSIESAELIKYSSNAFLATKISFINEIARLCDATGADITEIRKGMGSDSRIGESFLYAGLGYGGSCFPKDVNAMVKIFEDFDLDASLLKSTVSVNESQYKYFLSKLYSAYSKKQLKSKTISIWGLSFKPETDDIRESIAIRIINELSKQVKLLKVFDPVAQNNAKKALADIDNIVFCKNQSKSLDDSDALVIATEWREFWNPSVKDLFKLNDKVIFDGRNILDKESLEKDGFKYYGIGK